MRHERVTEMSQQCRQLQRTKLYSVLAQQNNRERINHQVVPTHIITRLSLIKFTLNSMSRDSADTVNVPCQQW